MNVEGNIMRQYNDDIQLKGRMFLFDFNNPDKEAVELTITGADFNQSDFYPHGIDGIVDKGKVYIYVVSHPLRHDVIEKFEYIPGKKELKHHRTFKTFKHMYVCLKLRTANDVTVTGGDTFYFTKYGHYRSHLGHSMEMYLQMGWGGIYYYDGKSYTEVEDGLLMANGIQLSRDKKLVYVCFPMGREIRVYKRESNDYLTLLNVISINTLPDNVIVDPVTGNLITGNHPIAYQVFEHLTYPDKPGPSQVS
ncbi:hypothetical protein FSP39_017786 [Pinctada imbricata]|uniref:Paraoxonase n=1 Tax=Pinctada imbricata TaxID=66713 RepID=A0AA88XUK2_PINIB|nr:hypothetical protein FSP39_017786 [Pinctada imbricata]